MNETNNSSDLKSMFGYAESKEDLSLYTMSCFYHYEYLRKKDPVKAYQELGRSRMQRELWNFFTEVSESSYEAANDKTDELLSPKPEFRMNREQQIKAHLITEYRSLPNHDFFIKRLLDDLEASAVYQYQEGFTFSTPGSYLTYLDLPLGVTCNPSFKHTVTSPDFSERVLEDLESSVTAFSGKREDSDPTIKERFLQQLDEIFIPPQLGITGYLKRKLEFPDGLALTEHMDEYGQWLCLPSSSKTESLFQEYGKSRRTIHYSKTKRILRLLLRCTNLLWIGLGLGLCFGSLIPFLLYVLLCVAMFFRGIFRLQDMFLMDRSAFSREVYDLLHQLIGVYARRLYWGQIYLKQYKQNQSAYIVQTMKADIMKKYNQIMKQAIIEFLDRAEAECPDYAETLRQNYPFYHTGPTRQNPLNSLLHPFSE